MSPANTTEVGAVYIYKRDLREDINFNLVATLLPPPDDSIFDIAGLFGISVAMNEREVRNHVCQRLIHPPSLNVSSFSFSCFCLIASTPTQLLLLL